MRPLSVRIGALALALCLCGCSNFDAEDRERYTAFTLNTEILSGADEPTQETVLDHFSVSYLPNEGFNPFSCKSTINRSLFTFLYDSLFAITADFQAEPVLCDTFSVSADLKTYRFSLVKNVSFSDGSAMTAADAVASLWAAKESPYYAVRLSHVVAMSALDNETVEIRLDIPYENLPLVLDVPIVKAATIQDAAPIGSGAYSVAAASLQRNKHDSDVHSVVVDLPSIELVAAETPNQIRDDFEFGNTDMVCTDPNAAGSAGYHGNYDIWDCPTTVMQYIGFNRLGGMFASTALRRAITYGIDRSSLILQELNGYAKAAILPCSPASAFYDPSLAEKYAFSPADFRAALQDAGAPESPAVMIVCSSDSTKVRMAQAIALALQEQNFFVNVRVLDEESYQAALKDGNYHLYYDEVKLPANFDLSSFFAAKGSRSFGGIADPTLAELCVASLKNSGSYHELFRQIMETAPICPILFRSYAVYAARETLDHLSPAVDNALYRSSGRTLADANRTFDAIDEPTDEATESVVESEETE